MSLNTASANSLLELLLHGTAIAGSADNAAVAPATSCAVSLHTADPGSGGTQATSEAVYIGYTRAAVLRSAVGWTIANNQAVNAAEIAFPQCTAGTSATYTHVGVQAGGIFWRGALSVPLTVFASVTPKIAAGAITLTATTSI